MEKHLYKIAVYIETYNEERRIGFAVRSFAKFDKVFVFDKGSTDKTCEIARDAGACVYKIPYSDFSMQDVDTIRIERRVLESSDCDWVFSGTASDVIHPALCEEIYRQIECEDFEVCRIPEYRYSMGFVDKRSFYGELNYKPIIAKLSAIDWGNSKLHVFPVKENAIEKLIYTKDRKYAMYHLTHESFEIIMERHIRYACIEAKDAVGRRNEYLDYSWKQILKTAINYFRRGTFQLRERGKAQLSMLLIYRCTNYLRAYMSVEKEREIELEYERIRNDILKGFD